MQEIIEFINGNKLLMTGFIASGLAVLFWELRVKARNVASLASPMAVRIINDGGVLVDIRDAEEFKTRHIVDAKNIAEATLLKDKAVSKNKKVVLVCGNGDRSGEACARLRKEGFDNVFSLRGGLDEWAKENLPLIQNDKANSAA